MPVTTANERALAARIARHAANAGRPVTTCPYNVNGTPAQRELSRAFTAEYQRRTSDNTDYR